jgi:hypothetical protein
MGPCTFKLEEKSKHASLAQKNGFASTFASAEEWKRHNKDVHLPEKTVINMIGLPLPVSDWPIIMIGPSGLLLVISRLFAVPVFSVAKN